MRKTHGVDELSVSDFELVTSLAHRLSLATVARERNIVASQVSRALARIERLVGARLFHRSTHGLSPTLEGQFFVERAQRICSDAHVLGEELLTRRASVEGRVRISISHIFGERLLVPAMEAICAAHPDLRLELQLTDRLIDIATDGVDIAVRAGVPPLDTRLAYRLGDHGRRLYAAPRYLECYGQPRRVEDLSSFRLIANSSVARQNQWRFEQGGKPFTVAIQGAIHADNTATVMSLALAGVGIARINDVLARPHVANGSLLPLLDEFADRTRHEVHAVTLAGRYRVSRVRTVIDWLRATFVAAGFGPEPASLFA